MARSSPNASRAIPREWLKFLRQIDRETPKDRALHLICDNYATHKHPAVQEWLAKHPCFVTRSCTSRQPRRRV